MYIYIYLCIYKQIRSRLPLARYRPGLRVFDMGASHDAGSSQMFVKIFQVIASIFQVFASICQVPLLASDPHKYCYKKYGYIYIYMYIYIYIYIYI